MVHCCRGSRFYKSRNAFGIFRNLFILFYIFIYCDFFLIGFSFIDVCYADCLAVTLSSLYPSHHTHMLVLCTVNSNCVMSWDRQLNLIYFKYELLDIIVCNSVICVRALWTSCWCPLFSPLTIEGVGICGCVSVCTLVFDIYWVIISHKHIIMICHAFAIRIRSIAGHDYSSTVPRRINDKFNVICTLFDSWLNGKCAK